MQPPFLPTGASSDELYVTIATSSWAPAVEAKHFIETAWPKVEKYLDTAFPTKLRTAFHPHFWELYLALSLTECGIQLIERADRKGRDEGPDFVTQNGLAVEAVTITAGSGDDAVQEGEHGKARSVPDDPLRLRLLNAISKKRDVVEKYLSKGIHRSDQPYVVALNGANVPSSRLEMNLPRVVRSLFPIGPLQAHFDIDKTEVTRTSYAFQQNISKSSGASVQIDGFLSEAFKSVSAVLYSCVDAVNLPTTLGRDFVVVHNPMATVPIALHALPAGIEYYVKDGELKSAPGTRADDV